MRKWSYMEDGYIKNVRIWGYKPSFVCEKYDRKAGRWTDENGKYIVCGNTVIVDTKTHTAKCDKCGTEYDVHGIILSKVDGCCPYCDTPDPNFREHNQEEGTSEVVCSKCGKTYFIDVFVTHFVTPRW